MNYIYLQSSINRIIQKINPFSQILFITSCLLISSFPAWSMVFLEDLENFKQKSLTLENEIQKLNLDRLNESAKSLFWTPTLELSANKSSTIHSGTTFSESPYWAAQMNWNLFHAGSDWNSFQSAKAQTKSRELGVLNESLKTELTASQLIFKSLELRTLLKVQQEILNLKNESLKILKDRFKQGQLPLQEVTKAEVDLAQQKMNVNMAELDLLENETQIKSQFISEIKTKQWPFNDETSIISKSIEEMPQIGEKYWLSQSLEQNYKASQGVYWPKLDLKIQYQENLEKTSVQNQWNGFITLSYPLWNQKLDQLKVSSAYTQYLVALNDYKVEQQSLMEKNHFLKEKIKTARSILVAAQSNLLTSQKLYQDVVKSFRLGRVSTNDLLVEQNRLLEVEKSLTRSQFTFHQSLMEACVISGLRAADCVSSQ